MLSDELNHPKVLISYSQDSAEHGLIHRFGEKRSQSLNAAPSLCIKQAPLATHEELSSDPCMSQNKTSVKPLASHHLQDAPTLYWLFSIPVLKNKKRTKFFDWSRLQLSEGLCVHF